MRSRPLGSVEMLTIHNLEVTFDVEGDGDEATFARLFAKHIRQWSRHNEDMKHQQRLSAGNRALGDRATGEGE